MALETGELIAPVQQELPSPVDELSPAGNQARWAAIASYLPQRTDNDIKNYWNTHLRKKLGIQGHDHDGKENGGPTADSVSKGKWERRLQTDIHMAKQALCEALSLHKSDTTSLFPAPAPPAPSTYASSAENIARLLQNWMKKSPKTAGSCDSSDQNASVGLSSSPSEGATFAGRGGFNCSNSDISVETEMPFGLLEKWLFDDTAAQGQDGNFMEMALSETADLF
ncbi:hypothetical protein SASPL_128338 [Salvia splendens]|uniref:Myb proto-oncogene protein, plant n=1 Tax=Salvia splendens TaxID=180675 RepID=A0A8X8XDW3_SALSN|nr:hypothetical protein SASPL_128338 [Salvia splendens]